MEIIKFQEKASYLNGYLKGVGGLCHGKNYVPEYKAIPLSILTDDVLRDIQNQILLIPSLTNSLNKCSEFEAVNDWEKEIKISLDKWIFNLILSNGTIEESTYLLYKKNVESRLVSFLNEIFEGDESKVWRFQIAQGFCFDYGFNNEAYAFKSDSNLLIITFGWVD
jgi:hypothetical protein